MKFDLMTIVIKATGNPSIGIRLNHRPRRRLKTLPSQDICRLPDRCQQFHLLPRPQCQLQNIHPRSQVLPSAQQERDFPSDISAIQVWTEPGGGLMKQLRQMDNLV